ncbi:hypothetical protein L6Q21_10825 [Sandaracinobacter sp. RS1-74]|uniref:hypothetical protein n=1 Tax=Sandaracinobacteroides sayramensis TaxID=2913411 RepID=UPI001EDC69AF|nr:hypothetical protein [Sandaracinobacteroides sayramensis]MCG2841474.1 hypothetical protein [Sandaracinobacteroides sayramensis]
MKLIIAAITMMIATPAFAQSGAPADVHAQHTSQGGTTGQGRHEGHDMSSGCCDKGPDGKMACCEKMKAEGKTMSPSEAPAADLHAGHGMGQH